MRLVTIDLDEKTQWQEYDPEHDDWKEVNGNIGDFLSYVDKLTVYPVKNNTAIDKISIIPLSIWLAGYAEPPKYAREAVTGIGTMIDEAAIRSAAWEYHLVNLIECGLMEKE